MQDKNLFSQTILKILGEKNAMSMKDLRQSALKSLRTPDLKAKYAISRAIKNLAENGLIERRDSGREEYARLTALGKKRIVSIRLEDKSTPVPAVWDGSWRVILLDLPESRKNERESLRYLLKKAGFVMLKNSAWISPYPYEFLFENIKSDLGLTTELIILKTSSLDKQTECELLSLFNIK